MLVDVKEEIRSIKKELTDFNVSLQFTQKRVVRAISFENFTAPSMPIFSDLKILKVHDLFQLKMLSFVYDCIKKIAPPYFHSFFELVDSVHQYSTQQVTNNDIFLTQMNTLQYGLRTVCYFGAKCWNDIPVEIKNPHLQIIFDKKSKPTSLKETTNFNCIKVDRKRSPSAQFQ